MKPVLNLICGLVCLSLAITFWHDNQKALALMEWFFGAFNLFLWVELPALEEKSDGQNDQ